MDFPREKLLKKYIDIYEEWIRLYQLPLLSKVSNNNEQRPCIGRNAFSFGRKWSMFDCVILLNFNLNYE